jgi:hypothetical protein
LDIIRSVSIFEGLLGETKSASMPFHSVLYCSIKAREWKAVHTHNDLEFKSIILSSKRVEKSVLKQLCLKVKVLVNYDNDKVGRVSIMTSRIRIAF